MSRDPRTYVPDIESIVGVRLIGVTGGVALIVAALFLLQLAIQRGYIGPLGRVLLATGVGVGMMLGGRYASRTRDIRRWGAIVVGAGAVIAYVALYASHGYAPYRDAIGTPAWVPLLLISVLVAGFLGDTVSQRDPLLATEATMLLWTTPVVVADYSVGTTAFGATILAAVATVVAVSGVRDWTLPPIVSVLPAYALTSLWVNMADLQNGATIEAGLLTLLFSVFAVVTAATRRAGPELGETDNSGSFVIPVLNVFIALPLLALLIEPVGESLTGGLLLLMSGVLCVQYYVETERRSRAAIAEPFLGYVTAAAGLAVLTDDIIRVGCLAAVILAASVVAPRLRSRWLGSATHAASGLLCLDAVRIAYLGGDTSVVPVATQAANAVMLLALASVFTAVYVLSRWTELRPSRTVPGTETPVANLYAWGATVLLTLACDIVWSGVALSVVWSVLGFTLIAVGTVSAIRMFRINGIGLLGITSVKVFIYDTAGLDPIPRILSFIVLGVILLVTSYFYARTRGEGSVPTFGE
ncbi:DUF2339 domain-containing protein [Halomicroarcula sp. GCM10025894]|uniref:DUF2339 domain-containing protein n=1 Tax=Halomicroarcula sp. GCM10025894 TaxID=3252673 RepID=UPI0036163DE4